MDRQRSERIRLVLAVLGLCISAYLTAVHYDAHVKLACSAVGIIDCAGVLTSPQSVWFHLPVAVYGLAWFLVAGALNWAVLRGARLAGAGLIWTLIGAATVVFLVYDELVVIGRICLWCSGVHLLVLASLVLAVLASGDAPAADAAEDGSGPAAPPPAR